MALKWVTGLTACAILVACGSADASKQEGTDFVAAAVADQFRNAQKFDDARRKPAEIIRFTGVKPGDKVLELIPGDGYWTRILSKVVGDNGRIYAVWPQNYARYSVGKVEAVQRLAQTPPYPNVTVEVQPTPVLSAPEKLDLVFTSQNYHDYPDEFMGNNDPSVLNDAVFPMLKPGGTYIVIDHAAEPGSGMRDVRALHRIDPVAVRRQVEAAGFEYVGETDVLRNPNELYKVKVFDEQVRGKTDKFALKFRKPSA